MIPEILSQLCSSDLTPTQHLETQQALVKQFAEILEFVLKFDEYKVNSLPASFFLNFSTYKIFQMTTPAIQNDFSYYRRMMSRQSLSSSEAGGAMIAGDEPVDSYLASRMSMFDAQPTPMLSVLSEAMTKFLSNVIHHVMLNAHIIFILIGYVEQRHTCGEHNGNFEHNGPCLSKDVGRTVN